MINWAPPGAVHDEACPVCAASGPHDLVLTARAIVSRSLAVCRACGARFYTDRSPAPYDIDEPPFHVQLYLEQGAGLQMLTSLPFAIETPPGCRMLEVGCGFGFTVDLARRVLGWDAIGFDPTPTTALGARLLGAPLRCEFLRPQTDTGGAFHLVLACETLEHVPDPDAFLTLLKDRLRHDGTLILTTPNGAAIGRESGARETALFQMLSPGSHLILYTEGGLRTLLHRVGFAHVRIDASATGLTAFAAHAPLRARADPMPAHHHAYRRYLEMLCESAPRGEWLWNGAAARLLALVADEVPAAEALSLFDWITDVWRARFGFDLSRVSSPLAPDARVGSPETFADSYPFCLAPVLYQRARIAERSPGRSVDLALSYLAVAQEVAEATLAQVRRYLMDDGALRDIVWTSRLRRARIHIEREPSLRLDLLAALGIRSGILGDDGEPPAAVLMREVADQFVAMVHGGNYGEAGRIAHLFDEASMIPEVFADTPNTMLHLLFCLGVLERNGRGRADRAAAHFARLTDRACALAAAPATAALAEPFIALSVRNEMAALGGTLPYARVVDLAGRPWLPLDLRDELLELVATRVAIAGGTRADVSVPH